MKRYIIFSLWLLTFIVPIELFAQSKDRISGAMMTTTTTVTKIQKEKKIKEPKELKEPKVKLNPKLELMGDIGFHVGDGIGFEAAFIAGCQIKNRFTIGGGIGFCGDLDYECISFPLFVHARYLLLKNTKVRPFVSLSVGGNIPYGLYLNPSIGIDIPLSKKLSIYTMVGYKGLHFEEEEYYGHHYYYEVGYISCFSSRFAFNVGVRF